jgi:hypothetical protein
MSCKFLWFIFDLILFMCKIIIFKRTRFCFCEKYNRIDFIMINASMSLRSMFFKDDYRSNCWQELNRNFYVIVFFTSNQDSSRNKICSARNVVVWNEQKDINDEDNTNKSNDQDTRVKKKRDDWLKRAKFLSSFFDVFVKENQLIYSYIQHV